MTLHFTDTSHPDYKAWLAEQARLTEAVVAATTAYVKFHNEGYVRWRKRLARQRSRDKWRECK